jgi:SAM-dependent methyltransferase
MTPPPDSARPFEDDVYASRFSDADAARKDLVWREIARFLQRYIARDARVLDLACDRGDFIRNIEAAEKWAADMRDVSAHLPASMRFVQCDCLEIADVVPAGHFDVVFMSNYLEHLRSSEEVVAQLAAVAGVTRPGGRVIVLQPNVRLVGGRYWDFIDHRVALTEKSLAESAALAGFETERMITRFLPYTTKSRLPQAGRLVRAYLAFPPAWLLLGKQTLYVGRRPGARLVTQSERRS